MKPDLHCHSSHSDGKHSPEFLLRRAIGKQISHLAITDHDFVTWDVDLANRITDIVWIPGIEISCDWQGREFHVVGLGIDPDNADLNGIMRQQRLVRKRRLAEMDQRLQKAGIIGLAQHMSQLDCAAWTRSHVAEFLITNGHSKSWQKAFRQFLSRKGRAYVPVQWCRLELAVSLINASGGIPVLAHPGRYSLTRTGLSDLIGGFKEAGGEAIEGSYGNIDAATRQGLCQMAIEQQLYISVGSDFHDAGRQWTDLGKIPALDDAAMENAVWNHPKWHF